MIETGRLRWLRNLFTRQKLDPCRKLSVLKPEGNLCLGKPEVRWPESVERDL